MLPGVFRWRFLGQLALVAVLLSLIGFATWLAVRHFRAERHLKAAREAIEAGRLTEAMAHLEAVVRDRPDSPVPHLLAVQVARRLGRLDDAKRYLERCHHLQAGVSEAAQLESLMLRAQVGEIDAVHRDLWIYVKQKKPQVPLILEALCLGYLHNNQLPPARRCLDLWQEQCPDDPQASCCRGFYSHRQGTLVLARDHYLRALEMDPDRVDVRLRLGQVYLDLNQFKEGAEQYLHVLRLEPDNADAPVELARCRRGLAQPDQARRLLTDYLRRHPETAPALAELGSLELEQGKEKEAEELLRRAVRLDPGLHRARFALYSCLKRLGHDEEARQERRLVEQIERDFARIEAIVKHELWLDRTNPALHHEVGALLYRNGQKAQAAQWFHSALQHDPDHRPSHALLADYYHEVGDKEQEQIHRDRARLPAEARP